jgi:hypothetical protein
MNLLLLTVGTLLYRCWVCEVTFLSAIRGTFGVQSCLIKSRAVYLLSVVTFDLCESETNDQGIRRRQECFFFDKDACGFSLIELG